MKKFMPVEELARDERFNQITQADRMADGRNALIADSEKSRRSNRLTPARRSTGSFEHAAWKSTVFSAY